VLRPAHTPSLSSLPSSLPMAVLRRENLFPAPDSNPRGEPPPRSLPRPFPSSFAQYRAGLGLALALGLEPAAFAS